MSYPITPCQIHSTAYFSISTINIRMDSKCSQNLFWFFFFFFHFLIYGKERALLVILDMTNVSALSPHPPPSFKLNPSKNIANIIDLTRWLFARKFNNIHTTFSMYTSATNNCWYLGIFWDILGYFDFPTLIKMVCLSNYSILSLESHSVSVDTRFSFIL